jgi:hypothetical protein
MTGYDWNETARGLAGFVQKFRFLIQRGVVPLQVESEPGNQAGGCLLFGIFGTDREEAGFEHCEAGAVRHELQDDPALHELGFGVSGDGATWAMLIATDQSHYQTGAGRALQRELLRIFLEDAVQRAGSMDTLSAQSRIN